MIGSPGEAARARAVKIPQTTRTAASSDDAIDRAPVDRAVVAGSIIAHLLARDSATSVLCPEAENAGYSQAPRPASASWSIQNGGRDRELRPWQPYVSIGVQKCRPVDRSTDITHLCAEIPRPCPELVVRMGLRR